MERGGEKPHLGLRGNGRLRNGGEKKKWRQEVKTLSSKEFCSEEKERKKKVANKEVGHTRSRKAGR